MLIKFKVSGNLRFLSHAELNRVFQRACIRAGVGLVYSEGFNPRPKLSLPLPKSVGIEVDDDLLCLKVKRQPNSRQGQQFLPSGLWFGAGQLKAELSGELPAGCQLLDAAATEVKAAPQPLMATYLFKVSQHCLDKKGFRENLNRRIKELMTKKTIIVKRTRKKARITKSKQVDIRTFLKSLKLADDTVIAECRISSAGTVRVDEILHLLGLSGEMLSAPVRRTAVEWQYADGL